MTTRAWLVPGAAVALAIGSAHFPAAAPAAAAEHPRNVVFILIDDLRYDGMGFLQPELKTPNIDRLARGGSYFPNTLVTSSLCSPSRATILTGQTTRNHRIVDNNDSSEAGLVFFPSYLQQAGYQTGFPRQVAHGAEQRRPAAGLRQVGELHGPGRVQRAPGADAERGWTARPAEGLHHGRADRLRDGVAPERARSAEALLPLPEPQGGPLGRAARAAARPSVRRDRVPHPGERRQHARELPGQADVGLQPAQHLARHRFLLPHRLEDDGVPARATTARSPPWTTASAGCSTT